VFLISSDGVLSCKVYYNTIILPQVIMFTVIYTSVSVFSECIYTFPYSLFIYIQ